MKTRIITALVAACIFIAGLCGMFTPVYPCFVALICGIASFEIVRATGVKNNLLKILSVATSAAIPFICYFLYDKIKENFQMLFPIASVYITVYLIIMVLSFKKTSFEDVLNSLFASFIIPLGFSSMIFIAKLYMIYPDKYSKASCVYYTLFAYFCAWMSDIFAYFIGRKFGRHKLAPTVSPKKSVEGAIGGVIGAVLLNIALLAVFDKFFFETHHITYTEIIILTLVLSVFSIFGDLSASVIKRKHGIKDFGNILPGHGGVMDRFDSCFFVLPLLYSGIIIINMF